MEKERLMLVLGIAFAVLTAFFCWCYTKKSPKVEKWGWRVIGLLAAGFAVFTVWYQRWSIVFALLQWLFLTTVIFQQMCQKPTK